MSILILLHFIFVFFLLLLGFSIYLKYKKTSGKYFLLFSILNSLWFILYIFAITLSIDKEFILIINRIMYGMSLTGMYSMLVFVLFFNTPKKSYKKVTVYIDLLFAIFFSLSVFTPYILKSVEFVEKKNRYIETYGDLYVIFMILYLLFIPLFFIVSYYKIKNLRYINKIRLKYVCIGFYIFIVSSLIFLVILPYYGYILIDTMQIVLLIPFLLLTFHSIHSYHFCDLRLKLGEIIIFMVSAGFSITFVNIIRYFYLHLGDEFTNLWGLTKDYGYIDIFLGIIFFLILNKYLGKKFLGFSRQSDFASKLNQMKKQIPFISNLGELNTYLKNEFYSSFKIKFIEVRVLDSKNRKELELYKFFTKYINQDMFVNDLVFIEENKNKFNYKFLQNEINKKAFIILPLFNNKGEPVGVLSIGKKPFKDYYSLEEIKCIQSFRSFLEGHLKYIKIYENINDLSINLDKKVDEKTIEFNSLISKQKEFISMVSHEIKGPIASSIFQMDSILDDVSAPDYDQKKLKKELVMLNEQLLKSGELINKLFNIQKYENNVFELFKEQIDMENLLHTEVASYKKEYVNIDFLIDIKTPIGFMKIDKIQFKQVIDNLLTNAIKSIGDKAGIIYVKGYTTENEVIIEIEDNGKGLHHSNLSKIFDKYSTGESSSIGLGMGLYLCKKIVNMHKGDIKACNSETLGGAKFIICLPS